MHVTTARGESDSRGRARDQKETIWTLVKGRSSPLRPPHLGVSSFRCKVPDCQGDPRDASQSFEPSNLENSEPWPSSKGARSKPHPLNDFTTSTSGSPAEVEAEAAAVAVLRSGRGDRVHL